MKRRKGSGDPVFAAEMDALAAEHFAAERARMNAPPPAEPRPLPPLHVSTLHVHDDECWEGAYWYPEPGWRSMPPSKALMLKNCRRGGGQRSRLMTSEERAEALRVAASEGRA